MRRILLTAGFVAALIAAAGATAGDPAAAGPPSRPNVVVVMTDDQRAGELGPMRTVRRKLAGKGVSFVNAFATFPLCCPSRATFLTGQYAHNHGVADNEWPDGGYRAFDDSGSLPIALENAGYRTGLVGKYLNEYNGPETPSGWSRWAARLDDGTLFDYRMNVNGRTVRYGSRARDYQTDVIARRGERFIRQSSGSEPFFLWASFYAPHREFLPGPERWNPRPAPRHRGRYARARLPKGAAFDERDVSDKPSFVARAPRVGQARKRDLLRRHRSRAAALLSVDDAVARLLKTLRQTGELENTLVVFMSDNGFLMGEHRLEHKELLYEESVRVPLIMRGPGLPAGTAYDGIVGNIDLAPTILDAAGVEPLRQPDGVSLPPLVADPALGAERDILLENSRSTAVRTPDWLYAEHLTRRGIELELYDLEADPFQLRSLHDDPAFDDDRQELAARLDELRDCIGPGCS